MINKHLQNIIDGYLYTTISFKTELIDKTFSISRVVDHWRFYQNKCIKYYNESPYSIYPIGTSINSAETYRYRDKYWHILPKHL
jgi:hypothetical protein